MIRERFLHLASILSNTGTRTRRATSRARVLDVLLGDLVLVWSAYVDDIFVVPFLLGVDGFKRRAIGSVLSIVGIYR